MSGTLTSDETERAAEIVKNIVAIRCTPARREELVPLLAEQCPIYQNLSTGEAERIRGFILASFETIGLPEAAMPFVLEELETGINPYTVAAAAKALRGAEEVSDRFLSLLVAAAQRIAGNDDNVQYDTIDAGDRTTKRTSARTEILQTSALVGARTPSLRETNDHGAAGDALAVLPTSPVDGAGRPHSPGVDEGCCCAPATPSLSTGDFDNLALQDQGGETFTYGGFFRGRASVLTFFYTRCMNPQKCSLTISKLAALQRRIATSGFCSPINVGAITYDPAYDQPERLRIYGSERGFRFDGRNRFMRTVGSFGPIQAKFNLHVGFGPATVNRHSVELLVLDARGIPVRGFSRIQWRESEVIQVLEEIADPKYFSMIRR
jgi:cytochrome oxidase Cu insertion factor (SCO1/SenC/PrrC family)